MRNAEKELKGMLDRISLILVVIGALNWGSIGLFQFDIVAWIFGGQGAVISRIVYTLVALAGVWCLSLLFREKLAFTLPSAATVAVRITGSGSVTTRLFSLLL